MDMAAVVFGGFILDMLIGDPRSMPHPVVLIGKAISLLENILYGCLQTDRQRQIVGLAMSLAIVLATYVVFAIIIWLAFTINRYLGFAVSVFVMSQTLALRSLYQHAMAVVRPLRARDLPSARRALAMIVGRDTQDLDQQEIIRATVETVSENTVDGITAPLFYGMIGGPALAMAYKAVNTLDSMIGYRNERYRHFGWGAARIDDLVNFIPARITGLLYLLVAPFCTGGISGVWRALVEDARKHPSPNSGISEAAVAGALNIQLGGTNYYGGIPSHRAKMGSAIHALELRHIYHSLLIMGSVASLFLLIGLCVLIVVY